ncbi:MAG TPA: histidine phosphatase family protein [Pirellulales bacterium]|nr:histidine phosphatase family protein [Pirellulales bacterium]
MIVYVVRHAWAEDRDEAAYPDDDLRPLTAKGKKRFRRVVKRLVKRGFDPRRLATSPLVRCRQTADLIAEYAPQGPTPEELDDLKPGGRLEPLLAWTAECREGDVAWVGHAPEVEELTAALIGGEAALHFAKGAVAAVEFTGRVFAGQGLLLWLATAELLKA